MNKIALEIKSNEMEAVLDAVMKLAKKMKFEAKILSENRDGYIENFGELSSAVLTKLDKPSNRAVFERLKDK
ncbi:hypothetical protein [uncultured Campylobacter sp.]|uniref:hypothetical protein n=1 Tax=uncultured Campylobacter sp. TaxID=218934 RepID=UPI00262FC493|nr:hypothetical protein [uncultured Campylobacter sp.]